MLCGLLETDGEVKLGFNGDLYPTTGASVVMTTSGDMVKYQSGARARLGIGSANQILQVKSSLPSWETVDLADTVLSTQGDVLYENASGLARLGFGTTGDVLTTKGTGANPVWETPSAGGGGQMVLVDHTELGSDATEIDTTFTSINGTDVSCLLIYVNAATDGINEIRMQFNGMTSAYYTDGYVVTTGTAAFTNDNNLGYARLTSTSGTDRMTPVAVIEYTGDSTFTSTAAKKIAYLINGHMGTGTSWWNNGENDAEDITTFDQVRLYAASGNLRAGTSLDIYRVNKT